MSIEELIDKYIEKFGGIPTFFLRGLNNEKIAEMLSEAIRTGNEIVPEYGDGDY